jgi:hypothetical protein
VHVIFTVPDSLNRLWQFNRMQFANLLMQAARESLQKLLADPKFLGAQPGILSALHTWGRNLSIHPHGHCLVTAAGIDKQGRFIQQQRSTLLPPQVLMIVFRGRFRALLKSAVADNKLIIPTGMTKAKTQSLLNWLGRQTWNVRIQERYAHGLSVAGYLARYITGGPLSDRRLHSVSPTEIAFWYRDYRDGRDKLMRLPPEKFLKLWFEHVPPRGLRMIRRSGLYANCHAQWRKQIAEQVAEQPPPQEQPTKIALDSERCPQCNGIIRTVEIFRPRHNLNETLIRQEVPQAGQPP